MKCEICGHDVDRAIERHHIIPRRYGGGDGEENMIELCANCHRAIEAIYNKRFWEQIAELQAENKEWEVLHEIQR